MCFSKNPSIFSHLKSHYVFVAAILIFISNNAYCVPDVGGWDAQVLQVSGIPEVRYLDDYATEWYGQPWEFDNGSQGHIDAMEGLQSFNIKQGRLSFTTKRNSLLVWGDTDGKHAQYGQERIADDWKKEKLPWVVRIKMQQSRPRSEWYVEASYLKHGNYRKLHRGAELKGTGEQILTIPMGTATTTYNGLQIGTTTPGNRVSIDWIRVERPAAMRCFRYTFELDDEPLEGSLALGSNAGFTLYVNGQLVKSASGQLPFQRKVNIVRDIVDFRRGKNVIAVVADAFGSRSSPKYNGQDYLFLQGGVITENGLLYRIATDRKWVGAYWAPSGWMNLDFDESGFQRVHVKGDLAKNGLDGFSHNGRGNFREAPYFGTITIEPTKGREHPFFQAKELVSFVVGLVPGIGHELVKLRYSVFDSAVNTIVESKDIDLKRGQGNSLKAILSLPELAPGVYTLSIDYPQPDGSVDSRRQEFVVVGEVAQSTVPGVDYTDGMNLRLTDEIDFRTGLPDRRVIVGGRTKASGLLREGGQQLRITKGTHGKYLQTGNRGQDWASFEFSVGTLYRPHLLEIEYPDDEDRNMVFLVAEGSRYQRLQNIGPRGGIARIAPGVYTGDEVPISGEQHTERSIFWPNQKRATFTLVNTGVNGKERGAISRLRVYEILNDLPALEGRLRDGPPFVGPFVERVDRSTPQVFYTGELEGKFIRDLEDGPFEGYYGAWYATIVNLIKYLRFTGQNTYFAGVYMYYSAWFPSERFQDNYLGAGWRGGAIALMAEMFAANDLNLILGVQFIGSKRIVENDRVTDEQVATGSDSLRFIQASGRQVHGFANGGYNFLHPVVREEMLALAGELARRYSKYRSIKGVTWSRLPSFPAGNNTPDASNPIEVGYGDVTARVFEKDSGVTIPVAYEDPNRFKKRRDWLLSGNSGLWKSWRTKKVYEMDRLLMERLKAIRPDWRFWRLIPRPNRELIKLWGQNKISLHDIFKYVGLDPQLYEKDPSLGMAPSYEVTAYRKYSRGKYRQMAKIIPRYNAALVEDPVLGNKAIFARIRFATESLLKTTGKWPWNSVFFTGYSRPRGNAFYDALEHAAGNGKPELFIIGWGDVGGFTGGEQETRRLVEYLRK